MVNGVHIPCTVVFFVWFFFALELKQHCENDVQHSQVTYNSVVIVKIKTLRPKPWN